MSVIEKVSCMLSITPHISSLTAVGLMPWARSSFSLVSSLFSIYVPVLSVSAKLAILQFASKYLSILDIQKLRRFFHSTIIRESPGIGGIFLPLSLRAA